MLKSSSDHPYNYCNFPPCSPDMTHNTEKQKQILENEISLISVHSLFHFCNLSTCTVFALFISTRGRKEGYKVDAPVYFIVK